MRVREVLATKDQGLSSQVAYGVGSIVHPVSVRYFVDWPLEGLNQLSGDVGVGVGPYEFCCRAHRPSQYPVMERGEATFCTEVGHSASNRCTKNDAQCIVQATSILARNRSVSEHRHGTL